MPFSTPPVRDEGATAPSPFTLSGDDWRVAAGRPTGDWTGGRGAVTAFGLYKRAIGAGPRPVNATEVGLDFATADHLGWRAQPALTSDDEPAPASRVPSGALCTELSEWLRLPHVQLCASGSAAATGLAGGLLRADDHVVLDEQIHKHLYEAAVAATQQVHFSRHLDVEAMGRLMQQLRQHDHHRRILVMTEALFTTDAQTTDLSSLQAACRQYHAWLCVSVASDLGALGPGGAGQLALQDMLGKVDLVVGSFGPTLASPGGFLATRHRELLDQLSWYAAANPACGLACSGPWDEALAGLRRVRSAEGDSRRRRLAAAIAALRAGLVAHGCNILGKAAPVVPLLVGREDAGRMAVRLCAERGFAVRLLEHPEVPMGAARLLLQVSALHEPEQCVLAAARIAEAIIEAEERCGTSGSALCRL
ncbi:MAG: pyridoxal phosphate-dependent aminotransferase family protein [Opitutae bacterium]|nr:pyridoxal phosphate-dependent aminotransferase family protein [Opitutae bacterium]